MATDSNSKLDQIDTAATVRIDRRQRVFAQIEAALLADKLTVAEVRDDSAGTDPYNSGRNPSSAWNKAG